MFAVTATHRASVGRLRRLPHLRELPPPSALELPRKVWRLRAWLLAAENGRADSPGAALLEDIRCFQNEIRPEMIVRQIANETAGPRGRMP